jgi:hypothetical protein
MLPKVVALLWLGLSLANASAPPLHKAETELFTFWYYQANHKAAAYLMQSADQVARDISASLGLPVSARITVYLVPAFEDVRQILPASSQVPSWAIGAAFPAEVSIVLLTDKKIDLATTFRHEVNHLVLGQVFKGSRRVPRWLDEGLAMIQAREWSMSRLATMTNAALSDSLIPMDELVRAFPHDLRDAELAYCQSFYFISFLKGKFGDAAFTAFLRNYARSRDFAAAIQKTYLMSWESMEHLWLDYLELRFSWIPILTSTGTLWFLATLIFLAGYLRKRSKSRQTMELWTQQDVLDDHTGTRH